MIFKRTSVAVVTSYARKHFQLAHFLLKLSKLFINITDFYISLYFLTKLFKNLLPLYNNGFLTKVPSRQ